MHRYRRLMVGLSLRGDHPALIDYAGMVARVVPAEELRVVHVLANAGDEGAVRLEEARARMQQAVQARLRDLPATIRVSYDPLTGPLTDRLLAHLAEKQVDLFLIGHGDDQRRRHALARRLAMKAPSSIWLIPHSAPAAIRTILVPIDFSEPAADALRVAVAMAKQAGAEVLALHVYFNEAVITYEEYDTILRGQEEEAYRRFVAPIDLQGVTVTPLFEEGPHVSHVVERIAKKRGADLVVMATRGRSRSAAILLGSVTEQAIQETTAPLLVVKHFGAQLGLLQVLLDKRFRQKGGVHTD